MENDELMLQSFETAMLDYEVMVETQRLQGFRLQSERIYRRLKKSERWTAGWIAGEYLLVTIKASSLTRRERELVEYLGDSAAVVYAKALSKPSEAPGFE